MGTAAVMGTAAYSASEAFDCTYSTQTDIWALGCILYKLLTALFIWNEVERKPMAIQRNFFFSRGPNVSKFVPAAAKELVVSCLEIDSSKRPSADCVTRKLTDLDMVL
jgi:serine/threonine protein kinase